jgi:outer membrane protein assembly factor BamD
MDCLEASGAPMLGMTRLDPKKGPWARLPRWAAMIAIGGALSACDTLSNAPPAGTPPDKLYALAKEDLAAGNYDQATKALERIEGLAAGTLLAQQAQLELAYARWKAGERAQALAGLDRFIKLNPSSPALDYALYLRGLINFNDNLGLLGSLSGQELSERDQQASREAYQSFKQLVEQFPQSRYADDARLRMDYIVNALAEYEVHVARYYYRRGAFVAAINRAQFAVQEYRQTPATEEALFLLSRSYDQLGLPVLRDDVERVLKLNFPDSRFLRDGLVVRDKSWWALW